MAQSEFNKGAAYARDCIIGSIIGMQNDCHDRKSEKYRTLQELLKHITDSYGDMMQEFK